MSEENWKLERDLCRCCLNEGSFKNLAEPCLYEGQEEIYSEMLLEHLSVNLTPVSGPLCTSTYTICEECILRLRDACGFKRQVLLSEKRFRDLYARDVIQMQTSSIGVKKEVPDSDHEANEDDVKVEYRLDDDDDFRLDYDDDDNKSDLELDLQSAKKAKTKKPKAKDKPKPKKRAGRPRKKEAETAAGEAEPPKEKKDIPIEFEFDTQNEEAGTKYGCQICGRVCKTTKGLRTHLARIHATGQQAATICHVCTKEFSNHKSLRQHLRRTCLPRTHNCAKCGETFRTTRELIEHKRTHRIFVCRKCSAEFKDKSEMATHKCVPKIKTTTPRETKIYICDACGRNIRGRERDIIRHLKMHNFFKCTKCPKVYEDKKRFDLHFKRNHVRQFYNCGICGYKTAFKSVLLSHQRRVHMREKNVPCPVCNAMFFNTNSLNFHMVRHNPVKKFECRFCKKMFPRQETLKRHEMIHTGVKKKVCPTCDARFVQKASLTYHIKKYHPETV